MIGSNIVSSQQDGLDKRVVFAVAQGGGLFDGILFKVILLALFLDGIGAGRQFEEAKKRVAQQAGR